MVSVVENINIKQTLIFKQPFVEQVHISLFFEYPYTMFSVVAKELTFGIVEAQELSSDFPMIIDNTDWHSWCIIL